MKGERCISNVTTPARNRTLSAVWLALLLQIGGAVRVVSSHTAARPVLDTLQSFLFGTDPIRWVQHTIGLGWPLPFRVLSHLGSTWGVVFVLGLALWLWGRETLYAMAALVVLEAVDSVGMNQIFHLPRPAGPEIVVYEQLSIGSFPSGHVFAATLLWGGLRALGRVPFWLAAAAVVLVGVSRLYVGVHYLGDLVGAVVFALPLLWLWLRLWPPARRWLGRRSRTFFTTLSLATLAGVGLAAFAFFGTNPFLWNAAGIAAGAAIALPLEARRAGRDPGSDSGWSRARKVLIGLAGIIPLLLVDRLSGEDAFVLGAETTALATVWAVLGAPALFAGWHPNRAPEPLRS